jgi:ubiquinone/menaquinone biosynthesis C-methylase UbiE
MPRKGLRLDVGCGEYPKGDVNCDLFTKDTGHWTGKDQARVLNTKKIPNFVICDSQHLPFASESFNLVYCSHVIEHVAQPFLLFRELYRVSNHKTVIKCPHRLGERMFLPKNPFHLNYFKTSWFNVAAQRAGIGRNSMRVFVSKYRFFPSDFFFFFRVPFEITAVIDKTHELYSASKL